MRICKPIIRSIQSITQSIDSYIELYLLFIACYGHIYTHLQRSCCCNPFTNNALQAQHSPYQKPPPTQPLLPPLEPTENSSHTTPSTSSCGRGECPHTPLSRASQHGSSYPSRLRHPTGPGGDRAGLRAEGIV